MIIRSRRQPPAETGIISWKRGTSSTPLCDDIVRRILRWDPGAEVHPEVKDWFRTREHGRAGLRKLGIREDLSGGNPRLFPYQRVGSMWLRGIGRGILADEQGMGKTVTSLDASQFIPRPRFPLVICSNAKKADWVDHVMEWTDTLGYKLEGLDISSGWTNDWTFSIINYTQMAAYPEMFAKSDLVIADEVHKIRNRKTQMSSALTQVCGRDKPVFLLTASPNVNQAHDSWPLLRICDPDRFTSFWSFAYRFCNVTDNGYGIRVDGIRAGEQENLDRVLQDYMLIRKKQSDLEVGRRVVKYHMLDDQYHLYYQMEQDRSIKWDVESSPGEWECTAPEELAWITRLRQLAIHPGVIVDGYEGPSKLDLLPGIIRERDTKAVVFCSLAEVIKLVPPVLQSYGINSVAVTGGMSQKRHDAAIADFKEGDVQVLAITYGTGGEGLNLEQADRVIMLDLCWNPAGNQHAMNRIDRPGQKASKIEIIAIKTEDSIEDHVWGIVQDKIPVTIEEITRRMK